MDRSINISTPFNWKNEDNTVSENNINRDMADSFIDIRSKHHMSDHSPIDKSVAPVSPTSVESLSLSIDAVSVDGRPRTTNNRFWTTGQRRHSENSPRQHNENNTDKITGKLGMTCANPTEFQRQTSMDNGKIDGLPHENENKKDLPLKYTEHHMPTDVRKDDDGLHAQINKLIKSYYGKGVNVARKPTKYVDAAVVYDQRDFKDVKLFIDEVTLAVETELGETPKIELFDSETFASSVVMVVRDVVEQSGVIFVYLTENSETETFQLFCEEAIGLSRLGLNTSDVINNDRKWILKPVHTQPQYQRGYKVPIGLVTSTGINWYDKHSEHTQSRVVAIMKEAIRRRREMEAHDKSRNYQDNLLMGKPQLIRRAYPPSYELEQNVGRIGIHHRSPPIAHSDARVHEHFSQPYQISRPTQNIMNVPQHRATSQVNLTTGRIDYAPRTGRTEPQPGQTRLSYPSQAPVGLNTHGFIETDAMLSSYTNNSIHNTPHRGTYRQTAQSIPINNPSQHMQSVYANQPINMRVQEPPSNTTNPTYAYENPPHRLQGTVAHEQMYQSASLTAHTGMHQQQNQNRHQFLQQHPVRRMDTYPHDPVGYQKLTTQQSVPQPISHSSAISKVSGQLILEPHLSTDDVQVDNIVDCDGPISDANADVEGHRNTNRHDTVNRHRFRRYLGDFSDDDSDTSDSSSSDDQVDIHLPSSYKEKIVNIDGCRNVQLGSNNRIVEGKVSAKRKSGVKALRHKTSTSTVKELQRSMDHQVDTTVKSHGASPSTPSVQGSHSITLASTPSDGQSSVYKDGANAVQDGSPAKYMATLSVNIDDNESMSKASRFTDKGIAIETVMRPATDIQPFQTVVKTMEMEQEMEMTCDNNNVVLNSETIVGNCMSERSPTTRPTTDNNASFNIKLDESSSDDNNMCPSPTEMFSVSDLFGSGNFHITDMNAAQLSECKSAEHAKDIKLPVGISVDTAPAIIVAYNRVLKDCPDFIPTITNTSFAQSVSANHGMNVPERNIGNTDMLRFDENDID